MSSEPQIIERAEQPYVAIKVIVSMDELGTAVPPLNQQVFSWLGQHGGTPAGPPFWKYNVIDMPNHLELEPGIAVAQTVTSNGRVQAGVLPAGRYVSMHHIGHPSTLMEATGSLLQWAAAQGLRWDVQQTPEGEHWACRLELYHTDPREEPDMNRWDTELLFKLAD